MADISNLRPPPRPVIVDDIHLRNIQICLPVGPDPWHRSGKPQPCIASMKLSYSSAIAAATADDVSLSLDYGKLYRRIEAGIRDAGKSPIAAHSAINIDSSQAEKRKEILLDQDVRIIADLITNCGLGLLDETIAGVRRMVHSHQSSPTRKRASQASRRMSGAPTGFLPRPPFYEGAAPGMVFDPIDNIFGQCEVWVQLPKALLWAQGGLKFRSVTTWGYDQADLSPEDAVETGRQSLVLEQELRIEGIRCYCILGVNSHERLEKQCAMITLTFRGDGQTIWAVDTYQIMTKTVAERVEATSYQTVEALATFIARIATVEFGNDNVTVTVEKPSALAFVEGAGVEITRSKAFFAHRG